MTKRAALTRRFDMNWFGAGTFKPGQNGEGRCIENDRFRAGLTVEAGPVEAGLDLS